MSVSDDFKIMVVGADGEAVVYLVGELDLAVRDRLVEALTQASDRATASWSTCRERRSLTPPG